jgi:thiazolylpeptide-type bacteriocin precursor
MNDTSDLATLVEELHTLESETFEVRDYADSSDLLLALPPYLCSVCSSTSSTCA